MPGPEAEGEPACRRSSGQVPTLKHRRDFLLLARGVRRHARAFSLQVGPAEEAIGRIGYTLTRKVGTAVERNRIRRRLRAAVGAVVGLNPMAFDAVLIGRREGLHEPFDTLCSALAKELASASRRLPATPVDAPGV
ncbi:MAG TPA: ribonuclease P protein component [Beijerinckiaceae bacterium]|nr:ribonuclease P protein component [Beijerinckiaceae bacterium]